ncbi:MAG: RNA-binding cell elongation regulator Jag/EloR [Anaerovorax sp.]
MDFSEKWGKDVDEAVKLALMDLKLTKDEVDIIVLEEPTKGFFGLGSKLAKVRVEKKEQPKTVEKPKVEKIEKAEVIKKTEMAAKPIKKSVEKVEIEKPKQKFDTKESVKSESKIDKREDTKDSKFVLREKPVDLVPVTEGVAIEFLKELTEKMGLKLEITAAQNENHLYIDIDGKDSGTIIGKRGQTLDSVQYLTSLVVNKGKEKYIRVVVDAEHYREKREKTLEQLAERLADKVVKTKRSVRLEPMNPYERKVIHSTLQGNPKVTTKSEGEEPFRRVIIDIK